MFPLCKLFFNDLSSNLENKKTQEADLSLSLGSFLLMNVPEMHFVAVSTHYEANTLGCRCLVRMSRAKRSVYDEHFWR